MKKHKHSTAMVPVQILKGNLYSLETFVCVCAEVDCFKCSSSFLDWSKCVLEATPKCVCVCVCDVEVCVSDALPFVVTR